MVNGYHFLLRCVPCDSPFQIIREHQLHLLSGVEVNQSEDNFSNTIYYGSFNTPHDLFVISSSGVVECFDYEEEDPTPNRLFLAQSHLTRADSAIVALSREVGDGTPFERAISLMERLFSRMEYCSGVTSVATTAAAALSIGQGVCQDYSHILLSLCRECGIFARYVMGYVAGEGATHAWVDVWSEGVWRGLDPTHNGVVRDGYIKVAHGRDAADCSVVRGMRRGVANHSSQVRVVVESLI